MTSSAMDNQTPLNLPEGKLIVAIDPGTTNAAAAVALIGYEDVLTKSLDLSNIEGKLMTFTGWSNTNTQIENHKFPATAVFYGKDGSFVTGNAIHQEYIKPDFDSSRLIRHMKFMTYNASGDGQLKKIQDRVQNQLALLLKTSEEVLKDLGQYVMNELFAPRQGRSSWLEQQYIKLDNVDIEVVILVPPGSSTVEHELVRKAFVIDKIPLSSISLDSEVAAIFRGYAFNDIQVRHTKKKWAPGDRYVVADAGGGFGCFINFNLIRLNPLQFAQGGESTSSVCGSEVVTLAFEDLVRTRVPENHVNREEEIALVVRAFDTFTKLNFDGQQLVITYPKRFAHWTEQWSFTGEEIAACFAPCIEKLVNGIAEQIGQKPVRYVFLTGGFFASTYVKFHVSARVEAKLNLPIQFLRIEGKEFGVHGAILSRIDGNFITQKYARQTIAIAEWLPTPEEPPLSKTQHLFRQNHKFDESREYIYTARYIERKGSMVDGNKVELTTSEEHMPHSVRYLKRGQDTFVFKEEIIAFDFVPEHGKRALYCADAYNQNGYWVDEKFEHIPPPVSVQEYTWTLTLSDYGVSFDDFNENEEQGALGYRIHCEANEMNTRIWVEVRCSEKIREDRPFLGTYLRLPVDIKGPMYGSHDVSQHLRASFVDRSPAPSPPPPSPSPSPPPPMREDIKDGEGEGGEKKDVVCTKTTGADRARRYRERMERMGMWDEEMEM